MPPSRRVLGIDPGLTVTGFGIVDGDGVNATAVLSGVFRTRPKLPRPMRLREIFEHVGALIEEHHPDDLAIEQHFVALNVRSAMAIGEARSAAMLAAAVHDVPVYEYPATTVKEAVTGFGGAAKEQVQRMVIAHLRLQTAPERLDASDALAIALTRLATFRHEAMIASHS
jgi:crossover junction endodeoxyribonuclease RuvC